MKKLLALIISLLTIICLISVCFASDFEFDVGTGQGGNRTYTGPTGDGSGRVYAQWKWSRNYPTGTRYILELGDENETTPVGANEHDYYIYNLMGENFFRVGTATSRIKVNITYPEGIETDNQKAGFWFNQWARYNPPKEFSNPESDTGKSLQQEKVLILAKVIQDAAEKKNDRQVFNLMDEIYNRTYTGNIALKAEIVFNITPINQNNAEWLTYNEIRERAFKESNRNQFNWIRSGGMYNGEVLSTTQYGGISQYADGSGAAIDLIATKLYEKDKEFSLKNGRVNCSCDLFTSKANANYYINGNNIEVKVNNNDIFNQIVKRIGTAAWPSNYKNSYLVNYADLVMDTYAPNLCSIEIDGKYVSNGLNTSGLMNLVLNPTQTGDARYQLVFYASRKVNGQYKTQSHVLDARNIYVSSLISAMTDSQKKAFKTEHGFPETGTPNKPFIFEGWDYIYNAPIDPDIIRIPSQPTENIIYVNYFEAEKNGDNYSNITLIDSDEPIKIGEATSGEVVARENVGSYSGYDKLIGSQTIDGNTTDFDANIGVDTSEEKANVEFGENEHAKTVNYLYLKEPIVGKVLINYVLIQRK
jgi:hypothetical protein